MNEYLDCKKTKHETHPLLPLLLILLDKLHEVGCFGEAGN